MKKVLVTGGTVFVSRFIAEYYVQKNFDVYVLNRNTRPQSEGVTLVEADRRNLGNRLKGEHFDIVFDVTAYGGEDVNCLLDGLGGFDDYILVSSSAVYPDSAPQPFMEETAIGENKIWGSYGTGKVESGLKESYEWYVIHPHEVNKKPYMEFIDRELGKL